MRSSSPGLSPMPISVAKTLIDSPGFRPPPLSATLSDSASSASVLGGFEEDVPVGFAEEDASCVPLPGGERKIEYSPLVLSPSPAPYRRTRDLGFRCSRQYSSTDEAVTGMAEEQLTRPDAYASLFLDESVLDRLRAELDDDEGIWKVFVQNFIALLPHRIERLRVALTTGDLVGALDAVLSLKTSSHMVGAKLLTATAVNLELSLRQECNQDDPALALPRVAATHLRRIKQCAGPTTYLLQVYLR
jgi:HPt (histidine-containing phosphotransfer) domain-containing protein